MEKHARGELPLVKLQPLSPNELTQPRSSTRSRFSVFSLITPTAPAFHSAAFEPRCPRTILPLRSIFARLPGTATTSATIPPAGVGPLHMQIEVGTFW